MGQAWTTHTGSILIQMVALARTACAWSRNNFGMTTPVPSTGLMFVNCEKMLLQDSKGTVSQDFCFRFFSWINFPQAPENNIRVILNFFQKFAEIFASQGAPLPLVLLTPVANLSQVSTIPAANLPPVSMTLVANCHQYQWHRWQIMGTISGCRHLKLNRKANIYIYMLTLLPRGVQTKLVIFLIEDFFQLPPVSMTPVVTLSWEYLREFSKKIWNGRNCILRCLWETDSWKKPEVENLVTLSN